jgi:4-alpha-glucanotransferase
MSAPGGGERRRRSAGLLLHPTSLPGGFGIGSLGQEARQFVDFLVEAGMSIWQVLPLGPTGYGDSPYQSFSSFAGNPLLIDLQVLLQQGYLSAEDLQAAPEFSPERVDYGTVIPYKRRLLGRAFAVWQDHPPAGSREAFEQFCAKEEGWLEEFALFMALKLHFEAQGQEGPWSAWPLPLVRREKPALEQMRRGLAEEIREQKFQQFLFFGQWRELKSYAGQRGIRLIGDLPIFVAYDSADVWANQGLFQLDENGEPVAVAGVPPDYFSATGQLWGNPLYDWPRHREQGYRWWIQRVRASLGRVDLLRLDHFRGFEAYWRVPAGETTAVKGRWTKGPGPELLTALRDSLGDLPSPAGLPIIAEDLGVITPPVVRLRKRFGLPGMKVLQFAFDEEFDNDYLPHTYEPNCVVYTGTHDNDTTTGWYAAASEEIRDKVRRYLGRDGHDIAWDLVRLAFASVAAMAVVPVQDLLRLGSEARMNYPSRAEGNWQWRVRPGALGQEIAGRLHELAGLYDRLGLDPGQGPGGGLEVSVTHGP